MAEIKNICFATHVTEIAQLTWCGTVAPLSGADVDLSGAMPGWSPRSPGSKGAVDAMTRALARELGDDGIRVNTIAPGLTMSEQVEARREDLQANVDMSLNARAFKRDELPDDLVGTAVFLASADSDFMTGQTIVVDGGLIVH